LGISFLIFFASFKIGIIIERFRLFFLIAIY
jgi:hypothetical protein